MFPICLSPYSPTQHSVRGSMEETKPVRATAIFFSLEKIGFKAVNPNPAFAALQALCHDHWLNSYGKYLLPELTWKLAVFHRSGMEVVFLTSAHHTSGFASRHGFVGLGNAVFNDLKCNLNDSIIQCFPFIILCLWAFFPFASTEAVMITWKKPIYSFSSTVMKNWKFLLSSHGIGWLVQGNLDSYSVNFHSHLDMCF